MKHREDYDGAHEVVVLGVAWDELEADAVLFVLLAAGCDEAAPLGVDLGGSRW